MIRAVLAVALASALLGAALPTVERAERDRNAALAAGELERLADRAERLAADNDAVPPGDDPAATTVAGANHTLILCAVIVLARLWDDRYLRRPPNLHFLLTAEPLVVLQQDSKNIYSRRL